MATNSWHKRINDHSLSFGMVRYATGDKDYDDHMWRMVVSNYCGSNKLASIDVTVSDLVKIKSFCDKAIDYLMSDGGRLSEQPAHCAEEE